MVSPLEASQSNRAVPSPLQYSSFIEYFGVLSHAIEAGSSAQKIDIKWANRLRYGSRRTIGMIRSGKRLPSRSFLERLALFLGLSAEESLHLSQIGRAKSAPKPTRLRRVVGEPEVNYLAHWYTLVVKQLVSTPGFSGDPKWINQQLRRPVDPVAIKRAIQNLIRFGFIEKHGDELRKSDTPITTTTDVPVAAIRLHHTEQLGQAVVALRDVPVGEREFSSLTLSFDESRMQEAKGVIRTFVEEFDRRFATENISGVYQLGVQLFPHTRSRKK